MKDHTQKEFEKRLNKAWEDIKNDKKELLNEVLEKCSNAEIKDDEICQVTKKAVHQNFDWR